MKIYKDENGERYIKIVSQKTHTKVSIIIIIGVLLIGLIGGSLIHERDKRLKKEIDKKYELQEKEKLKKIEQDSLNN